MWQIANFELKFQTLTAPNFTSLLQYVQSCVETFAVMVMTYELNKFTELLSSKLDNAFCQLIKELYK